LTFKREILGEKEKGYFGGNTATALDFLGASAETRTPDLLITKETGMPATTRVAEEGGANGVQV